MKPKTNYSDEALANAFKQGNKEAGEVLYERYYSILASFCKQYLTDQNESQDIAQDILCDVFVKGGIKHYSGRRSFWEWIRNAAIHQCDERSEQDGWDYIEDIDSGRMEKELTQNIEQNTSTGRNQMNKAIDRLMIRLRLLYPHPGLVKA